MLFHCLFYDLVFASFQNESFFGLLYMVELVIENNIPINTSFFYFFMFLVQSQLA